MNRFSLPAVCLLVWTGLVLGCKWDHRPGHGLDRASMAAAMLRTDRFSEAQDPESCREACCRDPDCDLVLLGGSVDGRPQCLLVSCKDRDLCVLQSIPQFNVSHKTETSQAGEQAQEGGHKLRVVPLIGPWSPKTRDQSRNQTRDQSRNQTSNSVCHLQVKVGSCRAFFPRFYYDSTNQSCRSFIYGGCGANGNNFESREECEATCRGVTVLPDESTPEGPAKAPRTFFNSSVSQDADGHVESEPAVTESVLTQESEMSAADFAERCGAEPEVGPCRAAFQRWYYSQTGSCQSFIYGGCKGNKNNYISKENCMASCTVTVLPSSKKAADEVSAEYEDACMVTSDPGPCRAAFPMFYYDPNTATCQSFIYGGCRGNQNRYSSVEECMSRCSADGSFGTRGNPRDRRTAAIFLFVTLASISALLLLTLVIVTLRRHNLSRRPSSVSDKEELLPDEQSSLESLTVPESPKPDKA